MLCYGGCTSFEAAKETNLARQYITEDLEDQIIYNLIRGKNGLPFVHYDVSNFQSAIGSKLTPSIGGSRQSVTTGYNPLATMSSVARTVTRGVSGNVSGERSNQMTIAVTPIFDEKKIYSAYARFLNTRRKNGKIIPDVPSKIAQNAGPLPTTTTVKRVTTPATTLREKVNGGPNDGMETVKEVAQATTEEHTTETISQPTPPPPDTHIDRLGDAITSVVRSHAKPAKDAYVMHTLKHWEGDYYYVPIQYRQDFSNLCMSLVARGGDANGDSQSSNIRKLQRTQDRQELNLNNFSNTLRSLF